MNDFSNSSDKARKHGRDRWGKHKDDGRKRRDRDKNRRPPLSEEDLFYNRIPVDTRDNDFRRFFFEEPLLQAVAKSGYKELTTLQEKMIMPFLERKDLIVQASRGAGKTAAYMIPLMHVLSTRMGPRALIVTSTRELAVKAYNEARRLISFTDKRCTLIDPGSNINAQAKELDMDPEIVIGTPGRLLDHMRRRNLKMKDLDCLVVDEVDRILDQGQRPDLESLVIKIHGRDQTAAISSSISPPVLRLCRSLIDEGEVVELFKAPEKPVVEAVKHSYFKVNNPDKIDFIHSLIDREQPERAIVFCRTKLGATSVTKGLKSLLVGAMELHIGMTRKKQEQIVKRFREKEFNILVTTDAFTRELDLENISHVINFDITDDPEDYLFRIAKTARLSAKGRAMTLVTEDETNDLKKIESHIDSEIKEGLLDGFRPEPEPKDRRAHEKPSSSPRKSEDALREPGSGSDRPKTEKKQPFHGGWHRKISRRGRR